MSFTLVVKTAVRGYHVYRTLWEPQDGEELIVIQESGNSHERYVMAVYRHDEDPGVIVRHLPREISKTSQCFTCHALDSFGTHKAFGLLDGVLVK